MIAARTLRDLRSAVLHIGNADPGGFRLGHDELAKALKLCAQIDAGSVVEQNEKFEIRVISFRGNPTGDFVTVMAFVDHHIALAYFRYVRAMTSLSSHH